jgi:hypothetical protein
MWDVSLLEKMRDPLRESVGLPIGLEGAYYVGSEIHSTETDNPALLRHNDPPDGQPGLWCSWQPSGNGESYVWVSSQNYTYNDWLKYLIAHFFKPWHYTLSGKLECNDYFSKYVSPNGDEENEIEIPYVEKSELIVKDNTVIEKLLGTFKK